LLAEVTGAVSRRTGSAALGRKALRELETLPGLRLVEMNNALLFEAATLAADLGLRGADSVYVAVAKRLDVPLVTFDADQRERGKKQVPIHDI
jgi:predicted nucleic acid-binding protein